MATATDIITYIGIPLAVLGVLPILYTFSLSILTQRRIHHLLVAHGHKPHTTRNNQEGFALRASPMTSLIEVEMPRYTIAPVDRSEERYWEISAEAMAGRGFKDGDDDSESGHGRAFAVERVESTLSMVEEGRVRGFLRGGSWRTFQWRRLVVGKKLYRIQYEDELREPPAEIEFADLVNFLMDWGAELDGMGWEKLRSGGLWTPAGTVLLKVNREENEENGDRGANGNGSVRLAREDWVLRTSMPDDSDGILTLCVRWPPGRSYGIARNATSLSPGWGRLRKPVVEELDGTDSPDIDNPTSSIHRTLSESVTALTDSNKHLADSSSIRFRLTSGLITQVHPEHKGKGTGTTLDLYRLSRTPTGQQWFTSATSALLTLAKSNTAGSLWGFEPSHEILTFSRKDTVPCGVLVLLGLLDPQLAPHWTTADDAEEEERERAETTRKQLQRFQARLNAERLEAAMPPEQAQVFKTNRLREDMRERSNTMMQEAAARKAREQRRLQDAIGSPRMGVAGTAEACLSWLVKNKVVREGSTVVSVAEAVLYLLVAQSLVGEGKNGDEHESESKGVGKGGAVVVSQSQVPEDDDDEGRGAMENGMPVLKMLEEWTGWAAAGGMKREQIEMLEQRKREFCYAACLVAVVREAASMSSGKGKASLDMLECLTLWRKVRLG